jgi:uncharacterized protein (DUF1499 family)
MDMRRIERPSRPNSAFAGPAGRDLEPDMVAPIYPVAALHLYQAVLAMAAAQPRTYAAALYPRQLQAHFIARSTWFNFPDLITAQVHAYGPTTSSLTLYSRSVYGYSDLGVNQRRLTAWLAALPTEIATLTKADRL